MRRANGSGQIFKMKGEKRRKPWRVRVTFGWVTDEATGKTKQLVRSLGCFALSVEEAGKRLMETREITASILAGHTGHTIEEVYEKTKKDSYFNAQEAVDWRLADRIITRI